MLVGTPFLITHPLKNFISFIFASTFFTYPLSSQVHENTDIENDTSTVQEDNNYQKINLFVQLGATLSSGITFDETSSHNRYQAQIKKRK